MFYSNLKSANDEVVDLMELLLGIDEVEIDDSLLGLEYRKKNFVNFKKNRALVDMQETYSITEDNMTFLVTYIGLH